MSIFEYCRTPDDFDPSDHTPVGKIIMLLNDAIFNSAMIHKPENAELFIDLLAAKQKLEEDLHRFFNQLAATNEVF